MKVQSVKIKNFRNIEDLEKEINGANILLLGDNAVGKSNFLKAIQLALGNTDMAGVDQVMHGKQEAIIQVVTDDKGNEYTFQVKFKEGSDKPTITVTAPNGLKSSTKSAIGAIVGEINFDIDKFVEMSQTDKGRKEQVEIVRSFLSIEVKEQLQKHENKIKTMYEDRTELNRQLKTIDGFIKESDLSADDMQKYFFPQDISKLTLEINEAIKHNQTVEKTSSSKRQSITTIEDKQNRITKLLAEIESLKSDIKLVESVIKADDIWLSKNTVIDITELQKKQSEATDFNMKSEKAKSIRGQQVRRDELYKESENLTVLIETTRQLISDTIKDLDMPVAGLSFNENNLLYNGSIVDESTLSTSEIMMLGVKLKMAKNPNARILCIERGESLGIQKLKDLQKMAKDYDFQLIMEQVQRGTEKLVLEIMPEFENEIPH